ncbi:mediator of RNA polymerase II transcription subunit 8 [Recurvomyces mirabilis]|uniref:Mediator of RNA polymerase II transcription subunit 8 n=1 Tax=Recurvomyces mirabilis TaxID=574656 RepID=A0AAE0WNR5_9PEZI|nr:mediator of RNA polymerase II transcription subunit 8 [Recurvomyces mirabilis]KAK5157891.1 mediator of RNA polymerase II transcription subunit 8 [Recurvomyces mirabilis]
MALSPDQIRTVDQLRQKLARLSQTLQESRQSLLSSDPLPSWQELKLEQDHIIRNISNIQQALNEHRDFLTAAHAYPTSAFPGQTQEGLLGNLLRKKLEPIPEDWVARYSIQPKQQDEGGLAVQEFPGLWDWAAQSNHECLEQFQISDAFEDDYTIAEREGGVENVVTGLRRKLGEDESDSEDGDDDVNMSVDEERPKADGMEKEVAIVVVEKGIDPTLAPMKLENLLRFMTTGVMPAQK